MDRALVKTCDRCGIRYNPDGLGVTPLCYDCQEITGETSVNVWKSQRGKRLSQETIDERCRQMKYLTEEKKLSARVIAERLDISEKEVAFWRKTAEVVTPTEEINSRAVMWRREAVAPKRGSNAFIPAEERIKYYHLHKSAGWSKLRIEKEFGIERRTLTRIVEEVERGEYKVVKVAGRYRK